VQQAAGLDALCRAERRFKSLLQSCRVVPTLRASQTLARRTYGQPVSRNRCEPEAPGTNRDPREDFTNGGGWCGGS